MAKGKSRPWSANAAVFTRPRDHRLGQTSGWMVGQELVGIFRMDLAQCLKLSLCKKWVAELIKKL